MFTVYSKDGCKYCTMAIELLTAMKKEFNVIKLNSVAELNVAISDRGLMVQTFPQVFADNVHIGGYTDLHAYLLEEENVFSIDEDF
ncbi:glutaredoxin [Acanthocystis turfacea Chlorella virus OR0704.3]|nr:glutaredoxin [Acanthocystis turfacea Chlorella virus OR0704.3]